MFDNLHRQTQYDAVLDVLTPGKRVPYAELLRRMKAAGHTTDGIGLLLADLAYHGHKQLWRRSEIISYREPYFDHETEGNWTDGTLYIARATKV